MVIGEEAFSELVARSALSTGSHTPASVTTTTLITSFVGVASPGGRWCVCSCEGVVWRRERGLGMSSECPGGQPASPAVENMAEEEGERERPLRYEESGAAAGSGRER